MSHLTYIGDSDVGKYCNFGCGTVTCNYDGKDKFRTTIGDYCFIGCNTNLVAPVKVGDGAYTAAGSKKKEAGRRAEQVSCPFFAYRPLHRMALRGGFCLQVHLFRL
ncbi:Bifunctional protein GlmU [uncultured Clostridium sp.]|nr:Bifunctional protein GlmU [uncultured Clostridium sp.]